MPCLSTMRFPALGCLAFLVVVALPVPVEAQEILITGPLRSPPPEYCAHATPGLLEWSYFAAGGASALRTAHARAETGAAGAVGGEITFEVLRYHGFPSGYYGGGRGDAELRVGPWALGATRPSGGLVEGGLKLHLGGTYHASFGTWDVRAGTGYGVFGEQKQPHWVLSFGYGVRGVLKRYHDPWLCGPEPPKGPRIAEATVARLVLTLRRVHGKPAGEELVLGVELSPTFLLPPYSWWRFGGGPVR